VTSSKGYIRLHGRKQWYSYNYSNEELQEIANTVQRMNSAGIDTVYIFFNNDFEGYAPKNAQYLANILREMSES